MIIKIAELCSTVQLKSFSRMLREIQRANISIREIIELLYEFEKIQIINSFEEAGEEDKIENSVSKESILAELEKSDFQIKPPLSCPIMLDGLLKIITEEPPEKRYYEVLPSEEEFERKLEKSPKDINLWIEYGIFELPALNFDSLELRTSNNLHKTLNVLSRALKNDRYSSSLWNFYMEFYVRRGKEKDIRRMFEQALGFLNDDFDFCWRYYTWETEVAGRRKILSHMLTLLAQGNISNTYTVR